MEIELAAGKRYISLNIWAKGQWTKQPAANMMDVMCRMIALDTGQQIRGYCQNSHCYEYMCVFNLYMVCVPRLNVGSLCFDVLLIRLFKTYAVFSKYDGISIFSNYASALRLILRAQNISTRFRRRIMRQICQCIMLRSILIYWFDNGFLTLLISTKLALKSIDK